MTFGPVLDSSFLMMREHTERTFFRCVCCCCWGARKHLFASSPYPHGDDLFDKLLLLLTSFELEQLP